MIEVTDVTEEQLQIEKEYNDIVESYAVAMELSDDDADEKLEELINGAALSKEDEKNYIFRRDPKRKTGRTRTHIEFAMWLRKTHRDEKKTLDYFCDWVRREGHIVRYECLGSDRDGRVLLFNFRKRSKSPTEPDYVVWIDDKRFNLEIKNAGGKLHLKVCNLKKYKDRNAFIAVGFNGSYYLFYNRAVKHLLDNSSLSYIGEWGKEVLTITEEGGNGSFSLKELINKNLIRPI